MFYLGWHINFKYPETRVYLSNFLVFIFMCPWTVTYKLLTIQQQIGTVMWSDLDVQNGPNNIM